MRKFYALFPLLNNTHVIMSLNYINILLYTVQVLFIEAAIKI